MKNRYGNSRYYPLVWIILVLMIILTFRLFVLTVIEHKSWSKEATSQNSKEIYIPAPRGNIYDRNGVVLATTKQIFTATFNSNSMTTEEINKSSLDLINLLISAGDEYNDKFPIKIDDSGNFYYTYDEEKKKWLDKNSFPENIKAKDAFDQLRSRYEIDQTLDRYEAASEIYKKYAVTMPINIKTMAYSYDSDKKAFIEKFGIEADKNPSAKSVFKDLREIYKIDKSLSDEEARKIFIVRNEIASSGFNRYLPITIGKNLSSKTISYIEEAKINGVNVASETIRYYPNGSLAASILGYMGSISEEESKEYVKKGYASTDIVGKAGIEGIYEDKLKGTKGVKRIRVNARGEYIETISETKPKSGSDIYLTIDINLQRASEQSLAENIEKAQKQKDGGNCKSGSTVAIEPSTGDVLALANAPSYDPNIFATGISTEAWESVQSPNPRDPLSPAPLYNIATRASVQPGSIFKPITCIAAMECGLNPDMSFPDNGFIKLGDRTFGCFAWNQYKSNHGVLNMEKAIGTSCNYYFYNIATGKNWTTNQSFGYNKEMSIERMMTVGKSFGLGQKTGIELGEEVSPIPTAEAHKNSIKLNLWNTIYAGAHTYFPENVVNNDKKLAKNIDTIVGYIDKNPSRYDLFDLLEKNTDVKKDQIESLGDLCKYSFFNRANWGTGDIFNVSIGQGDNSYTPVQMANYIATLANNGNRNQVSIVKGISGYGITKKAPAKSIPQEDKGYLKYVIRGMERVVKDSGLTAIFKDLPVQVATKTGTAERSGKINPADEVEYIKEHLSSISSDLTWEKVEAEIKELQKLKKYKYASYNDLVDRAVIRASNYQVTQSKIDYWKEDYASFAWNITMAPSDNPKIAVSALLIQGGTSSNAVPVTRDVIAAYYKSANTSSGSGVNVIGDNKQY